MPQGREKLSVKCLGTGNFVCANAQGCPGGIVRVEIEQDIMQSSHVSIDKPKNNSEAFMIHSWA